MHRLLLLFALVLAAPSSAQSARALNTEGFRLYQAGKYPEALEKFEASAQADPKFALAHYNVAATLGVLRKQGQICPYSAHRQTILERLNLAVRLDPRRLTRARQDADLDPIRDTLGWQKLLGRSPERQGDVPESSCAASPGSPPARASTAPPAGSPSPTASASCSGGGSSRIPPAPRSRPGRTRSRAGPSP
ncbi:hypothetical protein ACN28I_08560 [Archangium gephyra]|uniref:hypothetical protein n=1 Tax=Archangium gephyra TaxID=48 RepID=UPI003B7B1859